MKRLATLLYFTFSFFDFAFAQNVGIGTNNPLTTLDVNGDVNIENRLFLNNVAGNEGQALISNGAGAAPAWQNIAYGNNDRFLFTTTLENYTRDTDTIFYNVRYAGSTAISYNNGVFTVNKSGLYKIEGSLSPFCSITDVNSFCNYSLYVGTFGGNGTITFYNNHMSRYNGNLSAQVQINQSIYLTAGSQFLFFPQFNAGSSFNFKRHFIATPLSIFLINE